MIQKIRRAIDKIRSIDGVKFELQKQVDELKAQNKFMLYELCRLGENIRSLNIGKEELSKVFIKQTLESFDWQWDKFNSGKALKDDQEFMKTLPDYLQKLTGLDKNWFKGKKVLDLGCGSGRFSYGLLSLGAKVTSADYSQAGVKATQLLCKEFGENHTAIQRNILEWDEVMDFDLVFSFGVLHHTGNSYKAIINATKKVKKGGHIYIMVYGFPGTPDECGSIALYEEVRHLTRNRSFEEKKNYCIQRFGEHAHGWFDAISPRINDLLTKEEVEEMLLNLGFKNVRQSVESLNPNTIGEKI